MRYIGSIPLRSLNRNLDQQELYLLQSTDDVPDHLLGHPKPAQLCSPTERHAPPLEQGAKAPLTIVANWEETPKR